MDTPSTRDRILAALRALAVGDAMGRATEGYEPDEILEVYEGPVTEFVEPVRPFDDEVWAAGEIGPPTQLVVALADPELAGQVRWLEDATEIDHLPEAVADGLRRTLDAVQTALPHPPAHAALSAGLAAAVDGHSVRDVLRYARAAAEDAGGPALSTAIAHATAIAEESGGREAGNALRRVFSPSGGGDALVAFIFGIVYATQSARRAIEEAVNQGGHAPIAAALAGAICAAALPGTLPHAWASTAEQLNSLDLEAAAGRYTAARTGEM